MNTAYDMTKDDWRYVDGVEDATFVPMNRTASAVSGVKALKRSLSEDDVRFGGSLGYTAESMVWHLWDATISGDAKPQQLDKIVDANGDTWSIQSVRLQTFNTRWRCVCNKQP